MKLEHRIVSKEAIRQLWHTMEASVLDSLRYALFCVLALVVFSIVLFYRPREPAKKLRSLCMYGFLSNLEGCRYCCPPTAQSKISYMKILL